MAFNAGNFRHSTNKTSAPPKNNMTKTPDADAESISAPVSIW
jgi:hypothetical protein